MASKPTTKSSKQDIPGTALQRKGYIPVQLTDLPIFDNAYAFMKERFDQEMRRVDQQMKKFSQDLMQYYGQTSTVQAIPMPQTIVQTPNSETSESDWDSITNSPLVQGEGSEKTLKLRFDLSQFDPEEINVKLVDDMLTVTAMHEEKTNASTVYREYNRKFMLPPGTNPEAVVSSLSRDGVLTVQAPLPHLAERHILIERQFSEDSES